MEIPKKILGEGKTDGGKEENWNSQNDPFTSRSSDTAITNHNPRSEELTGSRQIHVEAELMHLFRIPRIPSVSFRGSPGLWQLWNIGTRGQDGIVRGVCVGSHKSDEKNYETNKRDAIRRQLFPYKTPEDAILGAGSNDENDDVEENEHDTCSESGAAKTLALTSYFAKCVACKGCLRISCPGQWRDDRSEQELNNCGRSCGNVQASLGEMYQSTRGLRGNMRFSNAKNIGWGHSRPLGVIVGSRSLIVSSVAGEEERSMREDGEDMKRIRGKGEKDRGRQEQENKNERKKGESQFLLIFLIIIHTFT
ncbi:hypothetical protein ANN_10647 [Periplaneta americana]|uniref:Uncharacterized protein n=1 Tax=Periplaneta americana TaxID=6978 RepID=A0ABQ8T2U6_PERAM|nr:hypothetical protein ANN_10647 [Periplaneta americana]